MWQKVKRWCGCFFILPIAGVLSAAEGQSAFVFEPEESFAHYVVRAEEYLSKNKAWVNPANKFRELGAVMPFELLPDPDVCAGRAHIGVLLSHGLSDSPFSMRDPARALQEACFQVRVILLPGHGTKAEDLLNVSRDDWRDTFRNAAEEFSKEVDVLYVGGFSTGGALATEYAWQHADRVAGALLFSPVFKVNSDIDWLAPWLALVKDWLDNDPSDDFAKYASIPLPAIAEVYKLSKEVRQLVLDSPKDLPVFIALSADDQTVDSTVTETLFKRGMIGSKSQMVLYSKDQMSANTDRIKVYNTNWPEAKILGLSHMAVHGSPDNSYYGESGVYRICDWHRSEDDLYQSCRTDQANWFGEKSDALLEKSPHAARVSWNPNFNELMQEMTVFIKSNTHNEESIKRGEH
ncbi:alpha/beta fold hydrolase [Marinomonas sp. M1K-6]|uniref:Alpha/beta fold hydrolase n=1 Tax=Marinomonas profundi TaxID=2726122 RepID=A0A847RCA2_9GAMM|nr:alpha/beta fold hydrolase [Marinomonas profundi]NLQ18644.1 alpha/beta fold hydrolase [Marinomonas profundi]UDV04518.1 alpha/beta fold hydrolase [Marinomonas profundi]